MHGNQVFCHIIGSNGVQQDRNPIPLSTDHLVRSLTLCSMVLYNIQRSTWKKEFPHASRIGHMTEFRFSLNLYPGYKTVRPADKNSLYYLFLI